MVGEKLLDDEISDCGQDDEPQRQEIEDAAIILSCLVEIHEIAYGQQCCPGTQVDEAIEESAQAFRAWYGSCLQQHADQHAEDAELVPGKEKVFDIDVQMLPGFGSGMQCIVILCEWETA